jgi:hypothetical protein
MSAKIYRNLNPIMTYVGNLNSCANLTSFFPDSTSDVF